MQTNWILFTVAFLTFFTGCAHLADPESNEAEWTMLFDGTSLDGWTEQVDINWSVENGAITADNGPIGLLTTPLPFEDYVLELEFKAALGTNSGVFLNTEPIVKDESKDCYEVNIAPPSNGFPTGSIVRFKKVTGLGERDDWRQYRITMKDGLISVELDGALVCEYLVEDPRPAKLLGLQKNRGKIAFRNIRIRPAK